MQSVFGVLGHLVSYIGVADVENRTEASRFGADAGLEVDSCHLREKKGCSQRGIQSRRPRPGCKRRIHRLHLFLYLMPHLHNFLRRVLTGIEDDAAIPEQRDSDHFVIINKYTIHDLSEKLLARFQRGIDL